MTGERPKGRFVLLGNQLCLDFLNTQLLRNGVPTDLLNGFGDLVAWLEEARVLDAAQAAQIWGEWERRPEAKRAFVQALEFREGLREMAESILCGEDPPRSAISSINGLLRHRLRFSELRPLREGFERRSHMAFLKPVHLLCPVAEAACDLLCCSDLSLVKRCESEECVIFFYDTTRNHSRRWCDMATCGNREKAAAHYRRRVRAKKRGRPG